MGIPNGASSAYRGYRKQALYVLWRVLTDGASQDLVFRPEGDEDLAVWNTNNELIEAVQVKDHSSPLTLSDLKPASPHGFFSRLDRRRRDHPGCKVWLASFGPLGTELAAAIQEPGPNRSKVASKLASKNPALSLSASEALLASFNGRITHPDEARIRREIEGVLTQTIAGMHGTTAIELLLFWIFDASEHRRSITRTSLFRQLEHIGAYLSAIRDHSAEWNVAVGPLSEAAYSEHERHELRESYRRGAQANWGHILEAVDCLRPQRLLEVHHQFQKTSVVVIRGASGQGKSTLAFRYLRDYVADGLRFYVRFVDGRAHAIRIARALRNHISALGLRATVLLDVAPSDSGWMELVKDLTTAGVGVLVTVREEDYHRAGMRSGDFEIGEVALDSITRDEARDIYDLLNSDGSPDARIDFDDAWARFSVGNVGPLLEFTHIVREGDSLAKRIQGQVTRLQTEANTQSARVTGRHLKLLALAAIANEAESRLHLSSLCEAVGLDPLTRPLAVLQDEYFLRVESTAAHTVVAPLHSLRSHAIVSALLHDCPEQWIDLAVECLPLIVDADLERFLLSAFSRRPEFGEVLESALGELKPRSWTHAGAIARALVWEGLNRYERENHAALTAAVSEHGDSWFVTCDIYVASDQKAADIVRKTLAEIAKRDESELPVTPLTDKDRVFRPFRDWATWAVPPASPLVSASDWTGLGETAFWLGSKGIDGPLRNAAQGVLPDAIPDYVRIGELAQFVSGRYALQDGGFIEWLDARSEELSSRFVRETDSIAVVANDDAFTVLFPVGLADESSKPAGDAHDFHGQAMKRIALLRHLLPHKQMFRSQGVGADVLAGFIPNDETVKAIPIESVPFSRQVRVNAAFRNLVAYKLQRSDSWQAYATMIFSFRRVACDAFRGLHRGWARFLEHHKIQGRDFGRMPGLELTRLQASVIQKFPRTSVDEWGFVSEEDSETLNPLDRAGQAQISGNIQRLRSWRKIWQEYEPCVGRVGQRAVETSILHLAKKNFDGSDPGEADAGRLTVVNLAFAWKALRQMQAEFRQWFGKYVPETKLSELEQHEAATFLHLWPVAFAVVYTPQALVSNGASVLEAGLRETRRGFLQALRREVSAAVGDVRRVTILDEPYRTKEKTCLVVVCDHPALVLIEQLMPSIVTALWQATRFRGWRRWESTPLEVEWSDILVVNTIRGKAVSNAGSFVSTIALFAAESEFNVQPHHLMPMPAEMSAIGVSIWESPAIMKAQEFQGSCVLFLLSALRFWSIAQAAVSHNLDSGTLDLHLATYSAEISRLRQKAASDYEDLVTIVRAMHSGGQTAAFDALLARLDTLCKSRLMLAESNYTLTLDSFVEWAKPIFERPGEVNEVVAGIIDVCIEEISKG